MFKYILLFSLVSVNCFAGAGLVTGTLSPVNNTNSGSGGSSNNPFALGLSNSTLATPIYWTNRAGSALENDIVIASQTNYLTDSAISIFIPSAHSSGDGLVFPLFGTNFVAGAANQMDSYINANGILETNYLQDQFAMFIATVPLQSATSNNVSGLGNIAHGCGQIFMNGKPFTLNAFYQGKENTAMFFNPTNYTIKFLVPQTFAYDGMSNNFAFCTLTIDEPNNTVIVSNVLNVSSNLVMGYGNPNMSGGAGSKLFTNANGGGILYIDPTTISPVGALSVTNIKVNTTGGANVINIGGSVYAGVTSGGDWFLSDNQGEIVRFGGINTDNYLRLSGTEAIGWSTDGNGSIGSSSGSGIGRPSFVYSKSNIVSGVAAGYVTINTNQYVVAASGWTNTNSFNCTLYITSATAATFTYNDGTNNIFTDTGLTFTTAESFGMGPSYKITVASGTITGVAIASH